MSKRKTSALRKSGRSNAKSRYYDEFDSFLESNVIPMTSRIEPNQKTFTQHDLKNINPMTDNQEKLFDLWEDGYSFVLDGFPGCGKTTVACYLALHEILDKNSPYEKLIIVRSCQPTKDTGFLPGSQEEKEEIYELPYHDVFNNLFIKKNQYKFMKEAGIVQFTSTSYMRGLTFDNCIIVVDESASATYHELSTVITRMGKNSKIVFCGDENQNDLIYDRNLESGYAKFKAITQMMPDFRSINFTIDDCVRSGMVKSFLIAEKRYSDMQKR